MAVLDDADGRLLYARFFEEEGTISTFAALQHVLNTRNHYVRCPVTVHETTMGTLAVTYQGNLIAEFSTDGELLRTNKPKKKKKSTRAA